VKNGILVFLSALWCFFGVMDLCACEWIQADRSFLFVWFTLSQTKQFAEIAAGWWRPEKPSPQRAHRPIPYSKTFSANLGWGLVWDGIEVVNLPDGATWHEVRSARNDFIRVVVEIDGKEQHEWYADFEDESRQRLKLTGRVPQSEARL
jgi:hypothetical protein